MASPTQSKTEAPAGRAPTVLADPLSRLQALSFLAAEADALAAAADASLLAARTEEGLFYVACLGQFKRGKSSLINALLGEPVLPAGVTPVTSVVTIVRHGTRRAARVRLSTGRWQGIDIADLVRYVAEEENPENAKGVEVAEVLLPHPLLSSGLCLVDTPGLGSVFAGNTATTRSFLPHVDAALVVLGADPPISGEELALVEEVSRTVTRFLFVLNKADRLSPEECRQARRFAEQVLERKLGRSLGPILEVSAAEALAKGEATRELPALAEGLMALAREAGADMVHEAQVRGIRRLADRIVRELDEQRKALWRPLEESERRVEALRKSVTEAERALQDLGYLYAAEQERLSAAFTRIREDFLSESLPAAAAEIEAARAGSRRAAVALAREIARVRLEAWLPKVEPAAEELYRQATRRFVELANGFLERLSASNESFAENPAREIEPEAGFRTGRRFYFNDLFELAPPTGVLSSLVHSSYDTRRDATEYLRTLLEHNGTRLVNDLDERVLESRRRMEWEIRERLRERLDSAIRALGRAKARQGAGAAAVEAELARIDSLRARVLALCDGA
jgi:predicted GTPase